MKERFFGVGVREIKPRKVDNFLGHNVYTLETVAKEAIATISPNTAGIPVAITIRPDAYKILKARPDLLEIIYRHELEHDLADTLDRPDLHPKHDLENNEVIKFLREKGYDFGSLKF